MVQIRFHILRHESEAQKTLTVLAGHYIYQYPTYTLRNLIHFQILT